MKTKQKEQSLELITNDILKETRKRLEQSRKRSSLKDLENRSPYELFSENTRSALEARRARVPQFGSRAIPNETVHDDVIVERILGSNDLVDIRFLRRGARMSNAVGRVKLPRGFATGFIVAPGVLMTNWHVFRDEQSAADSVIEFGFRELFNGSINSTTTFKLDPDRMFFSNREFDVAIVAIGDRQMGQIRLAELPFCPLLNRDESVLNGERLNIIQHPAGQPKQIALRDNTVFAIPDATFLQYRADTRRGSSGSPVFNDEWEVVGLHHSGVPNRDEQGRILALNGLLWNRSMGDDQIDWLANEAIQSTAILRLFNTLRFTGAAGDLLEQILSPPDPDLRTPPELDDVHPTNRPVERPPVSVDSGVAKITVPVEISVRLGELSQVAAATGLDVPSDFSTDELRAFGIDRDYSSRNGFAENFVGLPVPLPRLTPVQQMSAAINRESETPATKFVLDYHNFSLIMNAERRLAFFTAVNIDGENLIRISRNQRGGKARWITDQRIGRHEQADNEFYRGRENRLDRGHLVRRLDPGWGATRNDSARGIVDTFHYTNCAPQYDRFNRTDGADGMWLGLENFVLDNADMDELKVSVMSGPVFREDDPDFRDNGLRIPRQYWKIIAWADEGELQTAAFLLSQESLLGLDRDIETLPNEAFDFRSRSLFQSTVEEVEELTQLDFGPLVDLSSESFNESFEILNLHDIMI